MINKIKISAIKQIAIYVILYLVPIYWLPELPVAAQNDTLKVKKPGSISQEQNISIFGSDEILNVSIYMDLATFLKKTSQSDSFDAEINIKTSAEDTLKRKAKLKYRGIIRKEFCSFPPIEINFAKPLKCDSGQIKKLKLVTHCEAGSKTDDYVLKEYLVYKLFNALTDTSLKARLLKVSYIDTKKNKKTIIKYGIFIEPVEMLAKRINTAIVKSTTLSQYDIIPEIIDRLAIFNYMVANWDWSVPGQHNVKILSPLNKSSGSLEIAVPYDFDLTGIVNAEYAIPPPAVPIENVRQRLYWGPCRSKETYINDLREFSDRKAKIYSVINDCAYLSKISKRDITSFMDEFFDQLYKPRSIDDLIEDFLRTCKK